MVGTPVDEHLNPNLGGGAERDRAVRRATCTTASLLMLRSTVHPGVTALTEKLLARHDLDVDVAFCPERIAEGKAMTELFDLPQIVSARDDAALDRARSCSGC